MHVYLTFTLQAYMYTFTNMYMYKMKYISYIILTQFSGVRMHVCVNNNKIRVYLIANSM